MKDHRIESICPYCHVRHDRAATTDEHQNERGPKPGDIAFCFDCGEWSVYDGTLTRRRCNDEDQDFIASSPNCRATREVWLRESWVRRLAGGIPDGKNRAN